MERISVDFKGPLDTESENKYLFTAVDEYSRFPFAYPCPDTSAQSVIHGLDQIFSMFRIKKIKTITTSKTNGM